MSEISLREYTELISERIEEGRHAEAAAHAKHILSSFPKYVAAYRLLGEALLEAGQDESAQEMFRRVLSADPENLFAWVGLGEIHNRQGNIDTAIWHMERAFELESDNTVIEDQLRHLYSRRGGAEPRRVQLTRGALARLYLKGDLLPRAISELRKLIGQQPDRADLRAALAEALWRNDQRLEASELCQEILDELPYCLKANLLLGEIWSSSGRDDAQLYLRRATALDPQHDMAQEMFGSDSILPPREVTLSMLDYRPATTEERPRWMAEMEVEIEEEPAVMEEAEAEAADEAPSRLEAQIEIPAWLEEANGEEATLPSDMGEEPAPADGLRDPFAETDIPVWLTSLDLEEKVETETVPGAEEETQEEFSAWFAGLADQDMEQGEIPTTPFPVEEPEPQREEIPEATVEDELAAGGYTAEIGLAPQEVRVDEPEAPPADDVLVWLEQLADREAVSAGGTEWIAQTLPEGLPESEGEVPAEAPEAGPAITVEEEGQEAPAFAEEEAPVPPWLEGEGLPSGEEALAWFEQLTAGKEEELRARTAAEAELRVAEIMGRTTPAEQVPEQAAPPEAEIAEAVGVDQALPEDVIAAEPELEIEVPAEPEPGAAEESIQEAEEEVPLPAWLMAEGLPSGEEALAWLEQLAAGKEEELRARATAEAELRTAEILGRPITGGRPEEARAEEEIVIEAPETEHEQVFGWTSFAPSEEPVLAEHLEREEKPLEILEEVPGIELAREEAPPGGGEAEEMPAVLAVEEASGWELADAETPMVGAPEPDWQEVIATEEVVAEAAEIVAEIVPAEVEEGPVELAAAEAPEAVEEEVVDIQEGVAAAVIEVELAAVEAEPLAAELSEAVAPETERAEVIEVEAEGAEREPTEVRAPEPIAEPVPAEAPTVAPLEAEEELFDEVEGPAAEVLEVAEEGAAEEGPVTGAEGPPTEIAAERARAIPERVGDEGPQIVSPEPIIATEGALAEALGGAPAGAGGEPRLDAIASTRVHLEENPRDYVAWLALARDLRTAGAREESLEAYSQAMRKKGLIDEVISDLREHVETEPDVAAQRLLGDAYMKAGLLDEALKVYRDALRSL